MRGPLADHPHIDENGVLLFGFLGAVQLKAIASVESLGPFVRLLDPENARVGAECGVEGPIPDTASAQRREREPRDSSPLLPGNTPALG